MIRIAAADECCAGQGRRGVVFDQPATWLIPRESAAERAANWRKDVIEEALLAGEISTGIPGVRSIALDVIVSPVTGSSAESHAHRHIGIGAP